MGRNKMPAPGSQKNATGNLTALGIGFVAGSGSLQNLN